MRRLSTRLHGILDYLIGALLIAMPWLFGYAAIGGPGTWIPTILGAGIIAYSLLTDYEMGVARKLDVRAHLWLDGLAGATLVLSLVFFGHWDSTLWTPYLLVGLLLILGSLSTHREETEPRSRVEYVGR